MKVDTSAGPDGEILLGITELAVIILFSIFAGIILTLAYFGAGRL
jgi:hypothetical protein